MPSTRGSSSNGAWRAAAAACALLAGCGGGAGDTPLVHRRILTGKVKGFDPAQVGDAFAGEMALQLYEPLYEVHYLKRPFELVPLTAAGMPAIGDVGRTYRIAIKPGVRFHDDACFPEGRGRPLEAGDFVYAWKRVADPRVGGSLWGFLQGQVEGLDAWREAVQDEGDAAFDRPVAGLRAVDAATLEIRLTAPDPRFTYKLAMPWSAAVPREAVDRYGAGFLERAVGTGAFRLAEYVRDSRIVLARNPDYHDVRYPSEGEPAHGEFAGDDALGRLADAGRRVPLCDRVEVSIIVEGQPQWLEFMSGNADFSTIPKDAFGQAVAGGAPTADLKARGVWLDRSPLLDLSYTCFNMQDPVLGGHPLLRRAMACAADRAHARELFANGRGGLAQSPIPPGLFGYDDTWRNPHQQFDLERARALLVEAGFPAGEGLPEFNFDVQETNSTARHGAELFQAQMARIGVRIRLDVNTWPAFLKKVEEGRTQIWGIGWGADYPDPENFLMLLYGPNAAPAGANAARFHDPEYDRLYERVAGAPDTPERHRAIRRMVEIACEANIWIFDLHRDAWVLHQPWCHNYKYPVIGGGYFKYVRVDPAERARRLGE